MTLSIFTDNSMKSKCKTDPKSSETFRIAWTVSFPVLVFKSFYSDLAL